MSLTADTKTEKGLPGSTPNSWRSDYPFESKFLELEPDICMHYVDRGPTANREKVSKGSTILCVHGNPTWSFYYRSIIANFSASHRVVAVDHIGCGFSDKPQNYQYTLAQHTANLVRLIDELDLRNITLVVHDWGGAIGLGASIERISRFRNLLVLNTAAFPPPFVPLRIAACRIRYSHVEKPSDLEGTGTVGKKFTTAQKLADSICLGDARLVLSTRMHGTNERRLAQCNASRTERRGALRDGRSTGRSA